MTLSEKPTTVSGPYTFSDVVEKACEGLMERKIKYSIRRIQEMEDILSGLEQELDEFLGSADSFLQKDKGME